MRPTLFHPTLRCVRVQVALELFPPPDDVVSATHILAEVIATERATDPLPVAESTSFPDTSQLPQENKAWSVSTGALGSPMGEVIEVEQEIAVGSPGAAPSSGRVGEILEVQAVQVQIS